MSLRRTRRANYARFSLPILKENLSLLVLQG